MAVPTTISIASTPNSFEYAAAITTSDTVSLTGITRAVYVGGAGNITAIMSNGDAVLFTAVPVGTLLPIRCTRINATATTATLLIAMY
tara:strand:+ start:87 stop:350 length:264 start_codon:yes stop_codon:yes gene_type:complete